MKMNQFWNFLGLSLSLLSCGSINQNNGIAQKNGIDHHIPGKCYAKCERFLYDTLIINEYTGELYGAEFSFAKKVNIEISPERTEWKKVKSDNCRSANPDDCLVYCQVKVPKESLTLWVVEDTSLTKKYVSRNVIQMVESQSDWHEVICDGKMRSNLIQDIKMILASQNYYAGNIDDKINGDLKAAIKKYQKDHGLAVGALTIEFIEHLGLEY